MLDVLDVLHATAESWAPMEVTVETDCGGDMFCDGGFDGIKTVPLYVACRSVLAACIPDYLELLNSTDMRVRFRSADLLKEFSEFGPAIYPEMRAVWRKEKDSEFRNYLGLILNKD